jgi:hypothetical protein
MLTNLDKARQLFKSLELRNHKSGVENAMRIICIQELLRDLKKK